MSNTVKINASLFCVIFPLLKLHPCYTALINLNILRETICVYVREGESYVARRESHMDSREANMPLKKGGKQKTHDRH